MMFALVAALLLNGCASQQYVPKEDEELYGTWVNTSYSVAYQKLILYSGRWEGYKYESDTAAHDDGMIAIVKKWTDAEGNVWLNISAIDAEAVPRLGESYPDNWLCKISKSGTVLERVESRKGFPTKIDPSALTYTIHYRQK